MERLPLETIEDVALGTALQCWQQLCGHGDLYPRNELGFGPLVGSPEILNGRSSVVATHNEDPLNYAFVYYGDAFNVYNDQSFVARRLGDLPDQ